VNPTHMDMEEKYKAERAQWVKSHSDAQVDEYRTDALADTKTLEKTRRAVSESIKTKYNLLQTAFRDFDLDKSGKLSLFELEMGIRAFNLPFPHEHILQIAQKYADQDGDNEISYAEFAAALSDAERAHDLGEKW